MIINANIQNEHLHLAVANSKRLPAQIDIIANFRTQKCPLPGGHTEIPSDLWASSLPNSRRSI